MNQKSLLILFAAELFVVVAVICIFRFIPEKTVAAVVASFFFIALGIFILLMAFRWDDYTKSLVFWVAQAHLFFGSIPMLVWRLLYLDTGFDQITIFGLPGPQFHRVATGIYMALIAATIVDFIRTRRRART